MIITNIQLQKKKKDRVNIYIDGIFSFGLDLETLARNNLAINQEICQEKIEKLIKEGEFAKLYDQAVRFLSFRPRSEKEVSDYLKKRKAGEKEILMVIKKLKEVKLLDDFKFCQWWLDQRQTFRPRSLRMIIIELRSKGVSREIIDEAASKFGKSNELVMANKLATKAYKRYQNLPKNEVNQKLSKYLLQRGFTWEIVKKTIDEFLKKE